MISAYTANPGATNARPAQRERRVPAGPERRRRGVRRRSSSSVGGRHHRRGHRRHLAPRSVRPDEAGRTGRVTARSACSAPAAQPLYWARRASICSAAPSSASCTVASPLNASCVWCLEHLSICGHAGVGGRGRAGRELLDEDAVVVVDARSRRRRGRQHRHLADLGHRQLRLLRQQEAHELGRGRACCRTTASARPTRRRRPRRCRRRRRAPARSAAAKSGYWSAKIGNIHGPSRMVA